MTRHRWFGFGYGSIFGMSVYRLIHEEHFPALVLAALALGAFIYFGVKHAKTNPDQT